MKTIALTLACVLALGAIADSQDIPGTSLTYKGPGTVTSVTNADQVADLVTNAPYGGLSDYPVNLVAIIVSNATGGSAKIKPKAKSSSDVIAVFLYGDTPVLQIDCGQSACDGQLYYVYAKGAVKKVQLKGLAYARKVVVDNLGAPKAVQVQNVSKAKGYVKSPGISIGGGIHSVITAGELDKLHSNHGGFGGSVGDPGVIAVGQDSPKAQVKCKGPLTYLLICKELTASNQYDYAGAYAECIASNAVLPFVSAVQMKQLNTKAIGPAVCAVQLQKLCSEKKTDVTEPLVGRENVIRSK